MQGFTNDFSTQLSVLLPKNKPLQYTVRSDNPTEALSLREINVQHFSRQNSKWQIDRIKITGLNLNDNYTLEVRDAYGELVDAREFKTLDTHRTSVRFAAAADLDHTRTADQRMMWQELLSRRPDFIILLGHFVNTLSNKPLLGHLNPDVIWASHVQARLSLDLYRSSFLTPTLAVWSSEDYGELNGNRNFKYKLDSADIFRIFYPQDNSDDFQFYSGPGTSRFWRAFQMGFAFLDSHTFRAAEGDQRWGSAQENWLAKQIQEAANPVWIFDGHEIMGSFNKETQAYDFSIDEDSHQMLKKISQLTNPTVLLSRGRQYFEIIKTENPPSPLKTFEIHMGAFHSQPSPEPWVIKPKSYLLDGWANKLNYAIIESRNLNGDLHANMTVFSKNNQILVNRYLSIEKKTKKLKTY